jgi:hypothetical protein
MTDFATQVQAFVDKAKGNIDKQVRGITLNLFSSVIMSSPVGNPELWAVNRVAKEYNEQVQQYNNELKSDPNNLTANGRLRRGKKLNDGMDIVKPKGYVGGMFRGNWQTTISAPAEGSIDRIDPQGTQAKAEVKAAVPEQAGSVVYLTNNLPYAQVLEFDGHSHQAP